MGNLYWRKRASNSSKTGRANFSWSESNGFGASLTARSRGKKGAGFNYNTKTGLTLSIRGTGLRYEMRDLAIQGKNAGLKQRKQAREVAKRNREQEKRKKRKNMLYNKAWKTVKKEQYFELLDYIEEKILENNEIFFAGSYLSSIALEITKERTHYNHPYKIQDHVEGIIDRWSEIYSLHGEQYIPNIVNSIKRIYLDNIFHQDSYTNLTKIVTNTHALFGFLHHNDDHHYYSTLCQNLSNDWDYLSGHEGMEFLTDSNKEDLRSIIRLLVMDKIEAYIENNSNYYRVLVDTLNSNDNGEVNILALDFIYMNVYLIEEYVKKSSKNKKIKLFYQDVKELYLNLFTDLSDDISIFVKKNMKPNLDEEEYAICNIYIDVFRGGLIYDRGSLINKLNIEDKEKNNLLNKFYENLKFILNSKQIQREEVDSLESFKWKWYIGCQEVKRYIIDSSNSNTVYSGIVSSLFDTYNLDLINKTSSISLIERNLDLLNRTNLIERAVMKITEFKSSKFKSIVLLSFWACLSFFISHMSTTIYTGTIKWQHNPSIVDILIFTSVWAIQMLWINKKITSDFRCVGFIKRQKTTA